MLLRKNDRHTGMDLGDELIGPISGSAKDAFDRLSFAFRNGSCNQLTLPPTDCLSGQGLKPKVL